MAHIPPTKSRSVIVHDPHSESIGIGWDGIGLPALQTLGALVKNGANVTSMLTASPVPGPSPEGPLAESHQLLIAFSTVSFEKMPPPTVAVFPTNELLLTGPAPIVALLYMAPPLNVALFP